ncbi:hypothetical protein [Sinorhizobium meliloti]|nr:hypothetical protein U8C39_36440 [Sinorhizobium meliloti]WQP20199.1 hypothetical protein U8C33_35280 [Sinorhizobium meliloti]WQP36162.1 hypothetical protein U8C45_37330 [Sinorhizobium meliloti]
MALGANIGPDAAIFQAMHGSAAECREGVADPSAMPPAASCSIMSAKARRRQQLTCPASPCRLVERMIAAACTTCRVNDTDCSFSRVVNWI